MLTDIFADRYSKVTLWNSYQEPERRLLMQAFRILSEQICPFYIDGNESTRGKVFWTELHSRLSMELGLKSLSPTAYSYQTTWNGQPHTVTGVWPIITVCENWLGANLDGSISPDRFIKERLSLIELGFRMRGDEIASANATLPAVILAAKRMPSRTAIVMPGDPSEGIRAQNEKLNTKFRQSAEELNARFRQAGCDLNYHNGIIQCSTDSLLTEQIEFPFWSIVEGVLWKNVDTDIKEAIDRRDNGARDSALYAARALESAIKIISDEKSWSHGKEKGAHNYIDNLASNSFIDRWEADALKAFFTHIRNPLGHGPGKQEMPNLTQPQTDWAIETCMTWIKSMIRRLP